MEPRTIIAGDSASWSVTHPDYSPDDGWTLQYVFINSSRQILVDGVDDGLGGFNISPVAADTAAWAPGDYTFQCQVTLSPDRHTIRTGTIEIKPNLARQGEGYDSRTGAQKHLDALLAARLTLSSGTYRVIVTSEGIGGRSRSFRTLEEIDQAIRRAERDVKMEIRRVRAKAGLGHSGNIKVRL